MNTLDEIWYFDHPQRTRTQSGATLSRFDKCSSPCQKNGKWSDALEATVVGRDLAPRRPMRVDQRCHINTLDELKYFYCPQSTRTYPGVTLSRFDKCSSPSQKKGTWSDALEATTVDHDPAPRHPIRMHQRCQKDTSDELLYYDQFIGQELNLGRPFPGLTNAAPPPRKMGNDQKHLRLRL